MLLKGFHRAWKWMTWKWWNSPTKQAKKLESKTPEPLVGQKVCSGFQAFCLFLFHGLKAHLNFLCHKNIIYKLREQNVVAIDHFVMTSQQPCRYTKKSLWGSNYPASKGFFLAWLLAFAHLFVWHVSCVYAPDKQSKWDHKCWKPCQKETSAFKVR